jgi:cellobiose-specific phosphotransferase system component IIB
MGSLTLIGTIHRDPNGLPRLMEILEGESPEIITLEMSEFGVAFRERAGPRLKGKLSDILRGLYGESVQREREKPNKSQGLFETEAIGAILLALELPFEFRAVKAYSERKGIPFRCIDLSKYSRAKLEKLQEEMITVENLRKIQAFPPMDQHEGLRKQRILAQRLTSEDVDQFLVEAFLNGRMGDGMALRDWYMSLRIKKILRNRGHTVHVGGWEHLLDDPPGKTLYGLLKDLGPRRVLSL